MVSFGRMVRRQRHDLFAPAQQHNTIKAPRITRLRTTSTRGVRARARRVAGCATSTGSAGHTGAQTNLKLTFRLDHPVEADQFEVAFNISVEGATSARPMKCQRRTGSKVFNRRSKYLNFLHRPE
jgi:hypothetical protein